MAINNGIVTIGRHSGKSLADCVKFYGHWVVEWLLCVVEPDEVAVIEAEIDRQAGPRTFLLGCPRCGHTTLHTNDGGCRRCAEYEEAGK